MKYIFQGKIETHSCVFGVGTMTTEDRGIGFARVEDNIRYRIKTLRAWIKDHLPKSKIKNGKAFDIFRAHHWYGEKQGERELHNFYIKQYRKDGIENAAMRASKAKYGRNPIDVGY